jgi:hypothetical protein
VLGDDSSSSSSASGDTVDKPGALGLWRNSARRAPPWRGDELGDGPLGIEELRGRGASRNAPGLMMPRTAWPVRLRMLFTGENAIVDSRIRTPSEATTILPGGAGATRAVTGADTRGTTCIAAGDVAHVATGASTIAAAGVGTGAVVGVEGAV